ncbi:MAG: hypothetical protein K8S94_00150 [Planctomycetia bacterium]|nr:hypothetical protein [Planctomycetia bacterium]
MARSHESVEGGLELLLDTITNTFGSILFITMLVAVLLRMTGRTPADHEPVSKTEQARAEAQVVELSGEIDRLKAALDALPPPDPVMARLASDSTAAAQEIARVLTDDTTMSGEIVRSQDRIVELERQATQMAEEFTRTEERAAVQAKRRRQAEEASAALAELAVDIDRPVDPDKIVQVAQLPELTEQKKKQFAILIKYGRIYAWHLFDKDGNRLGPNPDHFMITSRSDGNLSVKAKPDAGHIADGATVKQSLRRMLQQFPPEDWVVSTLVAEDSFAQFQTVKAALVDLGYQYEPIVVRVGEGLWDTGGVSVRAQ